MMNMHKIIKKKIKQRKSRNQKNKTFTRRNTQIYVIKSSPKKKFERKQNRNWPSVADEGKDT